jgi:1,4-dihydroxy-2-naphthoate octaprenyltransferase
MKLLRWIYRDRPKWWHFWNLYNPPGAVVCFFIGMALSTWQRDGRWMFIVYAAVFVTGIVPHIVLKPWRTNP